MFPCATSRSTAPSASPAPTAASGPSRCNPAAATPRRSPASPSTGSPVFAQNAIWNDFKLTQPNPDGFTIVKRTGPESTWIFSAAGTRASGLAYAGDLGGGLAVSIQNFWQSFPAALEVQNAASASAKAIAWLWSPDAPEMDMRFYDTHGHGLPAAYEDAQPGLSTAYGVARTSELTLFASSAFPAKPDTVAMAAAGTQLPLLAATPEYIHSTGVFGVWSLPDRSTAVQEIHRGRSRFRPRLLPAPGRRSLLVRLLAVWRLHPLLLRSPPRLALRLGRSCMGQYRTWRTALALV